MNDIVERLRSGEEALEYAAADEIERLLKYEQLVQFIANDYHELSHDKAYWQRDDWKQLCRKLIEEDHNETNS